LLRGSSERRCACDYDYSAKKREQYFQRDVCCAPNAPAKLQSI
jgi:hypothetical protein